LETHLAFRAELDSRSSALSLLILLLPLLLLHFADDCA
jgi:hypothetical protein